MDPKNAVSPPVIMGFLGGPEKGGIFRGPGGSNLTVFRDQTRGSSGDRNLPPDPVSEGIHSGTDPALKLIHP